MTTADNPPAYTEESLAWELFGGRATIFVIVMLLLMSLGVIGFGVYDLYQNQKFETGSVRTLATVTDKQVRVENNGGRQHSTLWMSYTFKDAVGAVQSRGHGVSQEDYTRLNIGDKVEVEYLPGEGGKSRIAGSALYSWVSRSASAGFGLIFGLMAIGIGYFGRRSARRRAHLIFHGHAFPGEIVSLEQKGAGKTRRLLVTYRYKDAKGIEQTSKPEPITAKFYNQLKQGQKITIVIDPANPAKCEPDYYGVRAGENA